MRRRTSLVTIVLLPAVALLAASCTGPSRPPAAEAAAELAGALSVDDVSAIDFEVVTAADPQRHLQEVTLPLRERAELLGASPTVTVVEAVEAEEQDGSAPRAEVTLGWAWPVTADETWEYQTSTELVWVEPDEDADLAGGWQVQWRPSLVVPGLQAGERLRVSSVQPERGDILGGDDRPLVTARDVWRIGLDKTRLEPDEWEDQARELARLVGIDADEYAERVEGAGEKAYVETYTIRQENPGVSFDVDDARAIRGVNVLPATMDLAPTSTFAAPVLGRAAEATAEIIEESDGAVAAGDVVGMSGIQRAYDEQLRGRPGTVVELVGGEDDGDEEDEDGRELFRVDPVAGEDVATTLDEELQVRAEEVLADVEPASAIVAVQPSTGDVLAVASGPGSSGYSTATLGQYAPGSTFKVVTALELLRSGLAPGDSVECPETVTVDGRTYSNVPGYPASATGTIPLRTAFAHSCNTAFIGAAEDVSTEDLAAAAADLGIGVGEWFGALGAYTGAVPDEATATGHAEAAIGQGEVLVSPLAMATVAASVAAGERIEPRLVRSTAEGDQETDDGDGDGADPAGVTAEEAATLRELMAAVVEDGSADILADVPGIVGAKTGTAQYGDGSQQHAWMLAVADDLAVVVFVEDGDRGSTTAGPLMETFLADR